MLYAFQVRSLNESTKLRHQSAFILSFCCITNITTRSTKQQSFIRRLEIHKEGQENQFNDGDDARGDGDRDDDDHGDHDGDDRGDHDGDDRDAHGGGDHDGDGRDVHGGGGVLPLRHSLQRLQDPLLIQP